MLAQYFAQQLQRVAYLFEFRVTVSFCVRLILPLMPQAQQKLSAFVRMLTNSVDPDQTAPIGAVCSGSRCLHLYLIRQ